MTRRSRRTRHERRRADQRRRGRDERRARRECRTGVESVDPHATWRDVYRALDVVVSLEPESRDPAENPGDDG